MPKCQVLWDNWSDYVFIKTDKKRTNIKCIVNSFEYTCQDLGSLSYFLFYGQKKEWCREPMGACEHAMVSDHS